MTISLASRQHWTTINPTTGEPITQYFHTSPEEVETGVEQLEKEYQRFKKWPIFERTEALIQLAQLFRKNKKTLSLLMAQEMGKPVRQGLVEIEKCALTCEYYAEKGETLLLSEEVQAHYHQTWLVKRPIGLVLAVMPWNFPFWQVIRCAVPAWLAGNVVLLKHAPSVQGCARWIQDLVSEAFRVPPLLQLPMTNEQTEALIGDKRIRAVSFTGSSAVGRRLASLAGHHLKKCVLELGGSDPYLILEDADIDRAAQICVKARFINSGQSCVAGKRFLIQDKVFQEFKSKALEHLKKLNVGDPSDEATDIGPLAEERLRAGVLEQLARSIESGAHVIQGGAPREDLMGGKGFFMEPTLIENVSLTMPVFTEECFGPVMPLMPFGTLEEGLAIANNSPYGLGAAIFSRDPERAWQLASEELEAGTVAINEMVMSDPRVPFGGIKDSGWGRELGEQGLLEFANLKTVGIAKGFF